MSKRIAALMLCCISVITFTACKKETAGGGEDTASPSITEEDRSNSASDTPSGDQPAGSEGTPASAGDTLNVAISGDSGTLVPSKITGNFVGVVRQYMEVLVDYKSDGTPVWLLATDIEEVSTSQWIIHCREGVTFSNGNAFDAKDVWFTFEYYLNDPMSANFLTCLDMGNSKIIDDYTIDLALSSYSMQQMGSLSQIYILDSESFDEEDFVMNPVGTGPYVVDEYVVNSHLYMKANPDYWGEKALIENLNYKVFNEDAQIVTALQTGTVDVSAIPAQDVEFAKTLSGYNVESYHTVFAATMTFNLNPVSVMNNLDARLAVCYAVDRDAMVDLVYFGNATKLDYPVSMYCLDYTPELGNLHPTYSVGRDIERAKEHAEKAGLVGKDIVVITNGSTAYITEAEILQANLKEIGVNVIINNYDAASYFTVTQDPAMYDISLYAAASPQGYAVGMLYDYVLWGAAQYAEGWPGYDTYLKLGADAVANPDPESRKETLLEMSRMFVEITPWYGLCDQTASLAINEELGGVEIWNSGGLRFAEWYWR
ncbi:MAG: ABC transporter substrate-binding protein [Oscillospiraceae bacterium]|nr:ABC transporter substrate-binding protein [Oscillospiraceae bacterium]